MKILTQRVFVETYDDGTKRFDGVRESMVQEGFLIMYRTDNTVSIPVVRIKEINSFKETE